MAIPSVARRSPATTTPSAKRMAATVVPWVTSGVTPGGSAGGVSSSGA